ncbi:hypothetical protein RPMA_10245 [Tardiphaga alba]|uniref:Membrane-bound lysozyme inhibitor of c-type lysozyme MliC n=1 Tax=Tardiphaga alba TaxID=340268 RepID=A0ABX8AKH5_9BRAD|nr:hypothetical protein RPMA_10245 [Tardiphaga alba]
MGLIAGTPNAAKAADLGLTPAGGAVIGSCAEVALSCENGRQYPVCPIAVSVAGEIVTARIQLAPQRSAYVRLVPMGVGYRYIGKGIWFDGLRENALLYLSKDSSVGCTVLGS